MLYPIIYFLRLATRTLHTHTPLPRLLLHCPLNLLLLDVQNFGASCHFVATSLTSTSPTPPSSSSSFSSSPSSSSSTSPASIFKRSESFYDSCRDGVKNTFCSVLLKVTLKTAPRPLSNPLFPLPHLLALHFRTNYSRLPGL